jgi:hypothetical protein
MPEALDPGSEANIRAAQVRSTPEGGDDGREASFRPASLRSEACRVGELTAYLDGFADASFLRSAQRLFIASAIRLRPSGVRLRFFGADAATAETTAADLLLGPLVFLTVPPARSARTC